MTSSSRKIRRVSDYLKLNRLIVWLWISCIFVTVVSSQDNFYASSRFGKRKDALAMSEFPSGSRFGRSGSSLKDSSPFVPARFGRSEGVKGPMKDSPKLFEMEPRVDRFFLGSRYGKRSASMGPQRAPPEALNYRRFEAAIDYLDRVKQDLAVAEEVEDEARNAPRDDEIVEAVYPYAYAGRSKI